MFLQHKKRQEGKFPHCHKGQEIVKPFDPFFLKGESSLPHLFLSSVIGACTKAIGCKETCNT
jgi:hypothetical protein